MAGQAVAPYAKNSSLKGAPNVNRELREFVLASQSEMLRMTNETAI